MPLSKYFTAFALSIFCLLRPEALANVYQDENFLYIVGRDQADQEVLVELDLLSSRLTASTYLENGANIQAVNNGQVLYYTRSAGITTVHIQDVYGIEETASIPFSSFEDEDVSLLYSRGYSISERAFRWEVTREIETPFPGGFTREIYTDEYTFNDEWELSVKVDTDPSYSLSYPEKPLAEANFGPYVVFGQDRYIERWTLDEEGALDEEEWFGPGPEPAEWSVSNDQSGYFRLQPNGQKAYNSRGEIFDLSLREIVAYAPSFDGSRASSPLVLEDSIVHQTVGGFSGSLFVYDWKGNYLGHREHPVDPLYGLRDYYIYDGELYALFFNWRNSRFRPFDTDAFTTVKVNLDDLQKNLPSLGAPSGIPSKANTPYHEKLGRTTLLTQSGHLWDRAHDGLYLLDKSTFTWVDNLPLPKPTGSSFSSIEAFSLNEDKMQMIAVYTDGPLLSLDMRTREWSFFNFFGGTLLAAGWLPDDSYIVLTKDYPEGVLWHYTETGELISRRSIGDISDTSREFGPLVWHSAEDRFRAGNTELFFAMENGEVVLIPATTELETIPPHETLSHTRFEGKELVYGQNNQSIWHKDTNGALTHLLDFQTDPNLSRHWNFHWTRDHILIRADEQWRLFDSRSLSEVALAENYDARTSPSTFVNSLLALPDGLLVFDNRWLYPRAENHTQGPRFVGLSIFTIENLIGERSPAMGPFGAQFRLPGMEYATWMTAWKPTNPETRWYHHPRFGWAYIIPTEDGERMYLYTQRLGWIYVPYALDRWVYSYNLESWLRLGSPYEEDYNWIWIARYGFWSDDYPHTAPLTIAGRVFRIGSGEEEEVWNFGISSNGRPQLDITFFDEELQQTVEAYQTDYTVERLSENTLRVNLPYVYYRGFSGVVVEGYTDFEFTDDEFGGVGTASLSAFFRGELIETINTVQPFEVLPNDNN